MNIQQLKYLVALDEHRHYGQAAHACHVSQPTMSMMMKKLEDELGVILFDRKTSPISPTAEGVRLIDQARCVLLELDKFSTMARGANGRLVNQLRLGIIPTIAPYLIPLFIDKYLKEHSDIKLNIAEITTEEIVTKLVKGDIDAGILSTPLKDNSLLEIPLFYEEFFIYSIDSLQLNHVIPSDLDMTKLWLLEEGHCFRTQVMKMCELKKQANHQLIYQTGNIESLMGLVDRQGGMTVVPELSTKQMTRKRKNRLTSFATPAPAREVSIVVNKSNHNSVLVDDLKNTIVQSVPSYMHLAEDYHVFDIVLQ